MQEVAEARIYDGVHYRISTEVGTAMGKQIGELDHGLTSVSGTFTPALTYRAVCGQG